MMSIYFDNVRLQTECSHYRTIAEEAYKHLTDILQRDVLSQSMNVRLTDWLELMEEVSYYVVIREECWLPPFHLCSCNSDYLAIKNNTGYF